MDHGCPNAIVYISERGGVAEDGGRGRRAGHLRCKRGETGRARGDQIRI